jgi:sugar fermentation stimulation protein A
VATAPLLVYPFSKPLLAGRLVRRYNRFLADVTLDSGEKVVAHCVNTGRMEGLTQAGLRVWLSHDPSPTRQLAYTWQITEVEGGVLVGTNTAIPNQMIGALLRGRLLPGFAWDELQAERRYGENSRVDFWLRKGRREHFIEVKNCHLTYPDGRGYFPDSVSERAAKHLDELIREAEAGHRASVIFTAQRVDTRAVRPSDAHDPNFADAARRAKAAGVKFLALRIEPTPEALIIHEVIPADLKPYDLTKPKAWMETNRALGPAWVTVRKQG